jgi:magnesium-transporting ATPase (P-type)
MFEAIKWSQVKVGQIIKVLKDEDFPSDVLLLKSDKTEGIVFVDTMQLDGETNLKEKVSPKDTNLMDEKKIALMKGSVKGDAPNENMVAWDGNITATGIKTFNCGMTNLMLRGCTMKNTEFCMGLVIYTGPETKIMMNAKAPPTKVSNVQRMMNYMLYSVFLFQLVLILIFAILSNFWFKEYGDKHDYLGETLKPGGKTVFL